MPRSRVDDHHDWRQSRAVLLATDNKNSVIAELAGGKPNAIGYSAYGQQSARQQVVTGLGFNGELREARIGWYLLGNGYRAYNPRLMRFHSPDSWSPFGKGGVNAYMYCVEDPVNFSDPTGHMLNGVKSLLKSRKISKASSSSSLNPLIHADNSPVAQRTEAASGTVLAPSAQNQAKTSRFVTGKDFQDMRVAEWKPPLDPSTGDLISDRLPPGRRQWEPKDLEPIEKDLISYDQYHKQRNAPKVLETTVLANYSGGEVTVDRSNLVQASPFSPSVRISIVRGVSTEPVTLNVAFRPWNRPWNR